MNIRRTLAVIGATLALAAVGIGQAEASTYTEPSKADKRAIRIANASKGCADIDVDAQWAQCITGTFQQVRTRIHYKHDVPTNVRTHMLAEALIVWDGGSVVMEGGVSLPVDLRNVHRASKADKRALKWANAQCIDVKRTSSAWEACTLGAFSWKRGRVITDNDYVVVQRHGVYVLRLVHGSHGPKA